MNGGVLVVFDDLRFGMIDGRAFALGQFTVDQHIVAHFEVVGDVGDIPPATGDLAGIVLEYKLEQSAAASKAFGAGHGNAATG